MVGNDRIDASTDAGDELDASAAVVIRVVIESNTREEEKNTTFNSFTTHPSLRRNISKYIPKKISKEAIDIHGWLSQLVMEDQPFRIVVSLQYQEFSHYEVISRPTLIVFEACAQVGTIRIS
jgi:hypothetical protein